MGRLEFEEFRDLGSRALGWGCGVRSWGEEESNGTSTGT